MPPKSTTTKAIKGASANQRNEKQINLIDSFRLEYIKWFLTIGISVILYLLIAVLISNFYFPDIREALELAREITKLPIKKFAPEPKERAIFLTALIFFPIAFISVYLVLQKFLVRLQKKIITPVYLIAIVASLLILIYITYRGLVAANPFATDDQSKMLNMQDYIARYNFEFYFISTFIYKYFYFFLVVIFPVVLFFFTYDFKFSETSKTFVSRLTKSVVYILCSVIIIVTFFILVFHFPHNYYNRYDFNSVYYSMVQVFEGTPLLIDSFTNTYGLYPQFLLPLFKITGLSVFSFTVTMSLLMSIFLISILFFLVSVIENKMIVLFGFISVFYCCYMYPRIVVPFDAYFATYPIRTVFSGLLLGFAVIYSKKPTRFKYLFSFFLFPLGILWNPDFGIITFLTLVSFYSYLEFRNRNKIIVLKNIAAHLIMAVVGIAITFSTYSLIIKLVYGNFPDLSLLFSTLKMFSYLGFNLAPMTIDFHPWMIVALVYLIGILYAVVCLIKNKINSHAAVVFLITVLGIGSFSYYQGRSHNWNLLPSSLMAFLLLSVFADDLLKFVKRSKIFYLPFACVLFLISFSFFQTVYDYQRITDLIFDSKNISDDKHFEKNITDNANFIRSLTTGNEKIFLYPKADAEALIYNLSETRSAFNPGLIELFFSDDFNRKRDSLILNKNYKVFFDEKEYQGYDTSVFSILSSTYEIKSVLPGSCFIYFEKRKPYSQKQFVLKSDDGEMIHEVFNNNLKRLSYERGESGKINFGNEFSIQFVFKPIECKCAVSAKWATLFSNDDSSKENGMLIQECDSMADKYYVLIQKDWMMFPVNLDKWNYLSINVTEQSVHVFINGVVEGEIKLNKKYNNSDAALFVGSYKNFGSFFYGDIFEMKISNNLVNANEETDNWNEVMRRLGE